MRDPEPFIHMPPYLDCRDPNQRDPLERVEHIELTDHTQDDSIEQWRITCKLLEYSPPVENAG